MCKVFFFFVALRWAPRPFGGGRAKKKHHPGCFFFAPAPGKGKGRRSPVGSRHGARAKRKHHPGCFFFCCGPGERQGKEKPRWKPARGQSKKKNTTQGVFFFCSGPGERQGKEKPRWAPARGLFFALAPCRRPTGLLLPLPFPGAGAKKKKHPGWCFFFALAPCRLPTGLLLPLPFAGAAAKKKNTLGGVFFFALAPCRLPTGLLLPLPFAGAAAQKKTPWVVFFFLLRPRADAHSLTAGLCGDASPSPGRFFFAAAPPGPGWCFFFLLWPRPDAHSLTVGWGDFGKARVVFFFLLRPRRVFLDNSKKCLGYYIGSKKTRRGHSFPCLSPGPQQKKKTPWVVFSFCSGPVPASNGASPSLAFPRGRSKKKKHPGWCLFFCSGPVPASNGASPSLAFRRGRSKKKTPWVVFFFLLRPRADAHSLTAGLGGDASPSPGRCFFFCCGPARTGVVFFFLLWPRPDAHSLTVGWGDFGKARVVFFFLLRPRRVFLENSKKCLGYYIGSKKTRRGHSKKKNTTST